MKVVNSYTTGLFFAREGINVSVLGIIDQYVKHFSYLMQIECYEKICWGFQVFDIRNKKFCKCFFFKVQENASEMQLIVESQVRCKKELFCVCL